MNESLFLQHRNRARGLTVLIFFARNGLSVGKRQKRSENGVNQRVNGGKLRKLSSKQLIFPVWFPIVVGVKLLIEMRLR